MKRKSETAKLSRREKSRSNSRHTLFAVARVRILHAELDSNVSFLRIRDRERKFLDLYEIGRVSSVKSIIGNRDSENDSREKTRPKTCAIFIYRNVIK